MGRVRWSFLSFSKVSVLLLSMKRTIAVAAFEGDLSTFWLDCFLAIPCCCEFSGLHVELGTFDVQTILVQKVAVFGSPGVNPGVAEVERGGMAKC